MAGNARGKLKEEMEGIHKNLDWVSVHAQKAKMILGDTHPELHAMFDNLIQASTTLDQIAADVYSRL